eukprot:4479833-Pyramimonas_sp.AAC.1
MGDPNRMSKRKRMERLEPLYDRYNDPQAWRLSKRRGFPAARGDLAPRAAADARSSLCSAWRRLMVAGATLCGVSSLRSSAPRGRVLAAFLRKAAMSCGL